MKWTWKAFFIDLGVLMLLGLIASYGFRTLVFDHATHLKEGELTFISMVLGGATAPVLLAFLAGWRCWHLAPFIVASAAVGTFYGGGLVGGLLAALFGTGVYYFARKVGQIAIYYALPSPEGDPDDDETQE